MRIGESECVQRRQDLNLDPEPGGGGNVPDEGTGKFRRMLQITLKEERVLSQVEENFSTLSKMLWRYQVLVVENLPTIS